MVGQGVENLPLFSLILRYKDESKQVYERVGILEHDFVLDAETVKYTRLTLI